MYCDLVHLAKWASGEWACSSPASQYFKRAVDKLRGYYDINFECLSRKTGNKYLEDAHALALGILGIKGWT